MKMDGKPSLQVIWRQWAEDEAVRGGILAAHWH